MQSKEYEVEIGGKKVVAMFSDLANQANGSVILKSGGTVVMATAVISKDGSKNLGFFNLTVEYLEKFYAAGKILGGQYNKREGRPSDQAILAARMIDRTIRPLFDQHIKNAVQVIVTVIAVGETDPKILGINATSIALHMSDIPWNGPIGAVQVGKEKGQGEIKVNNYLPSADESVYDLDLLVCGKDKTINMIEAMAYELEEEEMGKCFDLASTEITKWEDFQKKLYADFGKEKLVFSKIEIEKSTIEIFDEKVRPMLEEKLFSNESKKVTSEAEVIWKKILDEKYPNEDEDAIKSASEDYLHHYLDGAFHKMALLQGIRADGRRVDEVRKLYAKAGGISDVLHGSGIFYRGETHVLSVLALGGPEDMQAIQGMESESKKRFMHHYNFPPYSGGETGRVGGINRREMGHGFLAEKALTPVIPEKINFPYTIRVVSESTASNGSTSQASICAATLALMDGGVPIKTPVAGISVGLMADEKDTNKFVLLTDIQGPEDHYGDMDFKVAGTKNGITAIQLDVKVDGVQIGILKEALVRAKTARLQILETITSEINAPRANISPNAPKILTVKIKKDQIGMVIGPGGKNINEIREKTNTEITIEEDGTVFVTGKNGGAEEAVKIIEEMTHEYKIGDTAEGVVVKLMDFGAFVRIGHDTEGLVHVSEIAPFRVEKVSDIIKEGDKVPVKIIKVDERGRLNFSIKEANKDFFKPKV
ncbi:MAG TPA: polyribonucleotide nucleotidyltransferase [Lentisphaeria bacterium]|uniref:Polyribonucleotide nucleotidyltransferase n=1 Tax=Candidatus Nomurabacteria bacterium GW2011_GWE1_35_16 TaxID=1618761 RepID=A0A0G0DS30_9BACT|nr:MAG: Polyribonucleotide nucleotidyltransferase [Candidatus Nomurabacteria bacterium GW2011_GWF1_34_20]KKP61574.1 MAG: Polyribonucleotide nucleotidyltransferase [Candidatus Nomurabacteria bacterium GW2011_GWE2_34_25]KKP65850.1 MAG: Polyribonucleotide nucleotidyltransferase [Candidatus Nomurabacteria bacterium GW2011_GWE1_35_16]KKP82837.1 MAG: Polyribonucleotide nucleotidyltransferase [Candidatus Nomurabacteria bacterium GW2011_GWF2_35_66]HAX65395.1 polyribonucleotide nucleotidyltransferase [C